MSCMFLHFTHFFLLHTDHTVVTGNALSVVAPTHISNIKMTMALLSNAS